MRPRRHPRRRAVPPTRTYWLRLHALAVEGAREARLDRTITGAQFHRSHAGLLLTASNIRRFHLTPR